MGAAHSAICLAMLPTGVSGSLDIKYCSSSNSNSGSGGGDGELMQQGSEWPAGGDVSRSEPALSKPTATAEEPRGVALRGGWPELGRAAPPHPPCRWGQDPGLGGVGRGRRGAVGAGEKRE